MSAAAETVLTKEPRNKSVDVNARRSVDQTAPTARYANEFDQSELNMQRLSSLNGLL
jgi:hypothetical protein